MVLTRVLEGQQGLGGFFEVQTRPNTVKHVEWYGRCSMQRCYRTTHSALSHAVRLSAPRHFLCRATVQHGRHRAFTTTTARQAGPLKVQSELEQRIAKIPIERFRNVRSPKLKEEAVERLADILSVLHCRARRSWQVYAQRSTTGAHGDHQGRR